MICSIFSKRGIHCVEARVRRLFQACNASFKSFLKLLDQLVHVTLVEVDRAEDGENKNWRPR
jgi:hypothetical protein